MRQKDLKNQKSCPDVNKINVYCSRLGKWPILSTGAKSLPRVGVGAHWLGRQVAVLRFSEKPYLKS